MPLLIRRPSRVLLALVVTGQVCAATAQSTPTVEVSLGGIAVQLGASMNLASTIIPGSVTAPPAVAAEACGIAEAELTEGALSCTATQASPALQSLVLEQIAAGEQ